MKDPQRLLDESGDALAHERRLLGAGKDVDPSAEREDALLAALLPLVGPAAGGAAPPASPTTPAASGGAGATAGSVGSASAWVWGAVGVVAIGAAATGWWLRSSATVAQAPATPSITAIATASTPVAKVEVTSAPAIDPSSLPLAEPGPKGAMAIATASSVAAEPSASAAMTEAERRASELREESRALDEARATLARGDGAGALQLLGAMAQRFPRGVLSQEREALAIDALVRSGQRGAAASRAAAFVKAYPNSPHAERWRDLIER